MSETVERIEVKKDVSGQPDTTAKVVTTQVSVMDESTEATSVETAKNTTTSPISSTAKAGEITIPLGGEVKDDDLGISLSDNADDWNKLDKMDPSKVLFLDVPQKAGSSEKSLIVSDNPVEYKMTAIAENSSSERISLTVRDVQDEKKLSGKFFEQAGVTKRGIEGLKILAARRKKHITREQAFEIQERQSLKEWSSVSKKVIAPDTKKFIPDGRKALIDEKDYQARSDSAFEHGMANMEPTKEDAEKSLKEGAKQRAEKKAKKMMEISAKELPKGCSKEVATEVINIAGSYAETKIESMKTLAKANGYSKEFVKSLDNIKHEVIQRIEICKKDIIKSYIHNLVEKVQDDKKKVEKNKETAEKKKEEAQKAKTLAQKAIEVATSLMKKIKKMLANMGLSGLNKDKQQEVIRKKSPSAAYDIDVALHKKKSAIEAKDAANFQFKMAEQDVAWAKQDLAIDRIKIEAAVSVFV